MTPSAPPPADPSGAWVDLLGDVTGQDVLLVDGLGSRAAALLTSAGARVHGRSTPGQVDAAAVGGTSLTPELLAEVARRLRPHGRLLLAAANRVSPLSLLDRHGRPADHGASMRSLRRAAAAVGLPVLEEYGLLRSLESPSTAFSLTRPALASLVLSGSARLITGPRRIAVSVLAAAARRGRAGPLVPAMGLLCGTRPPGPPVVGRIGVLGSEEVKVLFGDPPGIVQKTYGVEVYAAAEADALTEVEAVWPGLAPRLLARVGPMTNQISWLPGRPLPVGELSEPAARAFLLEAAELLGRLQARLSPDPAGALLVHGDYWLGNLLLDDSGSRLQGIIDWTASVRGDADQDLRFLVDEHAQRHDLSPREAAALLAEAVAARDAAG